MVAIIGLLGQAGVGKDTVAEIITPVHLVEIDGEFVDVRARLEDLVPQTPAHTNTAALALRQRAVQVALADPLKEYCMRVYDFSVVQLWGPSAERNKPDKRYPREHTSHTWLDEKEPSLRGNDINFGRSLVCSRCAAHTTMGGNLDGPCVDYLTPREALQQLGTEWGRQCWPNTWTRLAMKRAEQLSQPRPMSSKGGRWIVQQAELVVISDCRFVNEAKMLHVAEHEVWRISRAQATKSAMYQHASEAEQVKAADEIAQYLTVDLENNGSMSVLRDNIGQTLAEAGL